MLPVIRHYKRMASEILSVPLQVAGSKPNPFVKALLCDEAALTEI